MKSSKPVLVLVLAAILLLMWLSWLGYLAATATRPIVLSRPQFLVSQTDVMARIGAANDRPDPNVEIEEVLWNQEAPGALTQSGAPPEKKIVVDNLGMITPANGWQGPGRYILALRRKGDAFELAPIPRSPGYPVDGTKEGPPRIYPVTSDTLGQYRAIRSASKP